MRDFYTDTMTARDELGLDVAIWTRPVEVPDPIPFDEDAGLGEFVLSYDDVRLAEDPRRAILDFAQTTYEAGARLQQWPREVPEWTPPGRPRRR